MILSISDYLDCFLIDLDFFLINLDIMLINLDIILINLDIFLINLEEKSLKCEIHTQIWAGFNTAYICPTGNVFHYVIYLY